jgi:predicted nucleic acid-binding protein
MARAVVDATVVIAFADPDDEDHEPGEEIVRGIDRGTLVTGVVVHEALLEVLNFVNERLRPAKATTLLDSLEESAHYRLPYGPKGNVGRGRALFRRYPGLSFGDAMQVAFMESTGIEYVYSFDDDFDAVEGITRLESAENPYT